MSTGRRLAVKILLLIGVGSIVTGCPPPHPGPLRVAPPMDEHSDNRSVIVAISGPWRNE
jgi:hypothetical protein